MFKKFLLICAVICSTAFCYSCSKDEPDNPKQEENKEPEKPTEDEDGAIVYIGLDGTTYPKTNFRWRLLGKTFTLNYINYEIIDSHISITGCDEQELNATLNGKVEIIPTMVIEGETYKVRDLNYAFPNNNDLKSIILPNTLLSIGSYAFTNCKGLETLRIPDSVTKIGYNSFDGCSNLKTITLSKSIKEIRSAAFYCDNLTDIYCRSSNPPELEGFIVPTRQRDRKSVV